MTVEEAEILKEVKNLKEETVTQPSKLEVPNNVSEVLNSSIEIHSGISVKACICYESLSSNAKRRDFLIRRVIKNKEEYFIDGLALDVNSPRLIRVSRISYIIEPATQKVYKDAYVFLQQVLGINVDDAYLPEPMSDFAKAIEEVGNEITVLMYLVALDKKRSPEEREYVLDYVKARVPYLDYDKQDMLDYVISLAPDDDSFSMAFHRVLKKGKISVEPLLQGILNVITIDGIVHEKEKVFLARVIDWLKQDGYQIDVTEEK